MSVEKIQKKTLSFPDEEEESDLIINNDEFCVSNDFKISFESNFLQNRNDILKKFNLDKNYHNEKIALKNPKNGKHADNVENSNGYGTEEKTIFSKIAEDLYINCLNEKTLRKNLFDINEIKDDNYNKLTVEKYLYTCADKENSKNNKIINNFIERKNREQICKKILINQKNNERESQNNFKKFSSKHRIMKKTKSKPRSPEQFLDDQKIMEEKHKNYIDNLIKMHDEEINLCIKDRPTISKNSERLANLNKNYNKDIHLKLYEDYNIKKKKIENLIKDNLSSNDELVSNKKLDNEQIIQNSKRLYKEYEKKNNNFRENQIKQLKDIKNMSTSSVINKYSNEIISKRFINIYKKVLKDLFNKDISDEFNLIFGDFLLFAYKLGLVNKNYDDIDIKQIKNSLVNKLEIINKSDKKNKMKNFNLVDIKPYFYENDLKMSCREEKNRKNKLDISAKIVKKNGLKSNRSAEKKLLTMNTIDSYYENISEYKLIKEAWKIITKSKKFNKELISNARRVLTFFLSLCGIYKGNNIKDSFIKKEFPFLSKDQSIISDMDSNYVKHIYKYFDTFRKSIINNVIEINKSKKKEADIRTVDFSKNIERNSKSFIKKIFNSNLNKVKSKSKSKSKNKDKDLIYKKKNINHSKEKNENKSFNNSKKNINLNIDSIPKKNLAFVNNNNQILNAQTAQGSAKERNKNKLLKRIGVKEDKIQKINFFNNLTVQQNYNNLNKNQNSNSSFNSLFSHNKKIKDDSLNKSYKDGHNQEKKSSISQYIFNEDYRIKDDIESNSNLNDFEISKNQNLYNNLSDNNRKSFNSNNNKSSINDDLSSKKFSNTDKAQGKEASSGGQKKKHIFKIKIKDDLIKLIINKGDNIKEKVNGFCLENNLDEENKEQILEAINLKLSDSMKS